MIPLLSQEEFEMFLDKEYTGGPSNIIVYFTASWCGACSRLDLNYLEQCNNTVTWYKCDVDQNKYTLGYCGLKNIPSFVFIKDKKFLGKFTSSHTQLVEDMIKEYF